MKLTEKKRIVVKVGTSTLTHDTGKTNIARMAKLVSVLADLKNAGHQVVLVSSGAVGIGAGKLGMHEAWANCSCLAVPPICPPSRQRRRWGSAS